MVHFPQKVFQATADEREELEAPASATREATANFHTAGVNFIQLALDSQQ